MKHNQCFVIINYLHHQITILPSPCDDDELAVPAKIPEVEIITAAATTSNDAAAAAQCAVE